jgi:hypothetical protein
MLMLMLMLMTVSDGRAGWSPVVRRLGVPACLLPPALDDHGSCPVCPRLPRVAIAARPGMLRSLIWMRRSRACGRRRQRSRSCGRGSPGLSALSRNSGNSSMPPSGDDAPDRKPPRQQRRAAGRAARRKRGTDDAGPRERRSAVKRQLRGGPFRGGTRGTVPFLPTAGSAPSSRTTPIPSSTR